MQPLPRKPKNPQFFQNATGARNDVKLLPGLREAQVASVCWAIAAFCAAGTTTAGERGGLLGNGRSHVSLRASWLDPDVGIHEDHRHGWLTCWCAERRKGAAFGEAPGKNGRHQDGVIQWLVLA